MGNYLSRPNGSWPAPERCNRIVSRLTYECGFEVTPESSPGVSGDAVKRGPSGRQVSWLKGRSSFGP